MTSLSGPGVSDLGPRSAVIGYDRAWWTELSKGHLNRFDCLERVGAIGQLADQYGTAGHVRHQQRPFQAGPLPLEFPYLTSMAGSANVLAELVRHQSLRFTENCFSR